MIPEEMAPKGTYHKIEPPESDELTMSEELMEERQE